MPPLTREQPESGIFDTIFTDFRQAAATAMRRSRLTAAPMAGCTQICFCLGDHEADAAIPNLVMIPPANLIEFLTLTTLRHPTHIELPDTIEPVLAEILRADIRDAVNAARIRRDVIAEALFEECRGIDPWRHGGSRLRVMALASRSTMVMQHTSRALLKAFASAGCDTMFVVERSEQERYCTMHLLQEYLDFKPHITLNINALNTSHIHPSVFNVCWWQDIVDDIAKGETAKPWRERDLLFALDVENWERQFIRRGLQPGRLQSLGFGLEEDIYALRPEVPRKSRKVVFVGSSYIGDHRCDLSDPANQRLCDRLEQVFLAGGVLTVPEIDALCFEVRGRQEDGSTSCLWNLVMRRCLVRWLSEAADQGWEVDIWGRGWEEDEVARRFHRGMVVPGEDLARLYQGASHAITMHPSLLNHLRLAEIAGCGCAPLVWDNRRIASTPHWRDDQVLYFRDRASFHAALERPFTVDPRPFVDHFSYRPFVDRILATVAAGRPS